MAGVEMDLAEKGEESTVQVWEKTVVARRKEIKRQFFSLDMMGGGLKEYWDKHGKRGNL